MTMLTVHCMRTYVATYSMYHKAMHVCTVVSGTCEVNTELLIMIEIPLCAHGSEYLC